MALVNAPLLSFSAGGQIAKTQVYSRWKGRPYVRRYVTPADPKTTGQVTTRDTFTFLSNVWKISPADFRAPWLAYANNLRITDRNGWIKVNLPIIRDNPNLDGIFLSPGANGGLNVTPVSTPGSGQISVAMTAPSPLPSGWSIVKAVAACILDQDPTVATDMEITAGSDASDPYTIVLTGLSAADYQVAGWFVFQRSASLTDLAYGPGPTEVVTVT